MYTIHDYGEMIADRGRTDAYARAIRERVRPGAVVLDLGAGAGVMTLLACEAGARKVYAIESDGIIEVARELVRANGFADRVELIQARSTSVTLPEQVDAIVAEIHGVLPFYGPSPASIIDARTRFLKPGGAVIPAADTIMAAVVSLPDAYLDLVGPWEQFSQFTGEPGRRRVLSTWRKQDVPGSALVVEPAVWLKLDYVECEDANARGRLAWRIARPNTAHGFSLWFDCETVAGCRFSNSPQSGEEHVFGQAFFPWPQPCPLEPGDAVEIDIRADLVGEDYLWAWETTVRSAGGIGKAHYSQHQLTSVPFTRDWLQKTASSFVPSPNQHAEIDKIILDGLISGTRLDQIARLVAERFPDRFPNKRAALTHVGKMSMKYSK